MYQSEGGGKQDGGSRRAAALVGADIKLKIMHTMTTSCEETNPGGGLKQVYRI